MEFRMSGLFSNLDFRDAFKDLFLIRKDEIIGIVPQYGPLANILINHVVKAAKGGASSPSGPIKPISSMCSMVVSSVGGPLRPP